MAVVEFGFGIEGDWKLIFLWHNFVIFRGMEIESTPGYRFNCQTSSEIKRFGGENTISRRYCLSVSGL